MAAVTYPAKAKSITLKEFTAESPKQSLLESLPALSEFSSLAHAQTSGGSWLDQALAAKVAPNGLAADSSRASAKSPEMLDYEFNLIIAEFMAGLLLSILTSPVTLVGYAAATAFISNSLSFMFPLVFFATGGVNALLITTWVSIAGTIDGTRGEFWETWGSACIGNMLFGFLLLALFGPPGHLHSNLNPFAAFLVIASGFLLPLSAAVLGFNLSNARKEGTGIFDKTRIDSNGVSYQVLSF